ncbi:MAG: GNAT family N-acetyltransferase [Blastocatellia bacterium]
MSEAILETERLRLRALREDDLDNLCAIFGDAETMRYYPKVYDREEVRDILAGQLRRFECYGGGVSAMELKSTGAFVGDCGLLYQEVEGVWELEVAYHVRRDHWGHGFAPEAARGCFAYGFAHYTVNRMISMIRPVNTPSRRVAEKNGLTLAREIFWRGFQHCVYVMERDQWMVKNGTGGER